jgi:flagellar L-ring protein FlgH
MKLLILFFNLIFFSSCASYVQSIHSQIDREENAKRGSQVRQPHDPYTAYRNTPGTRQDKRPILNPVTLGGRPTTSNTPNLPPESMDQYGNKRVQANDLRDNDNSASLWAGKSSENFLFVTNNIKRQGDIVIIEVLQNFKNKITQELKSAYPERKPVAKTGTDNKKVETKVETPTPTPSASGSDKNAEKKVYDKISTQVVEEVSKDYLLVRGRKEIIYQQAKRFIEVQALVSRRDISDNDAVPSDKILEPKIMVLRY